MKIQFSIIFLFILLAQMQAQKQNTNECFKMPIYTEYITAPISVQDIFIRNQGIYDSFIGCDVPEFTAVTLDGDTITLKGLLEQKKIVVIDFWFMGCRGCIAQFPYFNKLVDEYRDNKNVIFLSLCRDSDKEEIKAFLQKQPLKTVVTYNCEEISLQYCVMGWPTTYIVSKRGKLIKSFFGNFHTEKSDTNSIYDQVKVYLDKNL